MSRATLGAALDEVFAVISAGGQTPVASLVTAGVKFVLDHEPGAAGVPTPCAVTMEPVGFDDVYWPVRVRVYVTDMPGREPQDLMVAAVTALDLLFKAAFYGPSSWQMGWNEVVGCHIGFTDLMIPREDGF